MAEITLIDTSSWIEALRSQGSVEIQERVRNLLIEGKAVWCDLVAVELWNGVRGEYEKRKLAELDREIPCLPISDEVWQKARSLAQLSREAGVTVPVTDLVIVSCALVHQVELEHRDEHFELIIGIATGG